MKSSNVLDKNIKHVFTLNMDKKIQFIISVILTCFFIKCSFKTKEYFILEKINLYTDPSKNEQVGRDLMYYDYAKLIKDSLKITDPAILQNIGWENFIASDTKDVTFRLNLQNEAISKKKELVSLFADFVANKLDEYKTKEKEVDTAVNMGYYYIRLINHHYYDSLWKQTSSLLEKYANKEQFTDMMKQRNANYRPTDTIQFRGRIVFNKVDNLTGDFYVIYYTASNNTNEQVTMVKTNHTYKLLGYHYAFSQ